MSKRTDAFRDDLAAPGFIKTSGTGGAQLSAQQRSVLVRKGNELFNQGQVEQAKRIFLTARYTDGIIRVGDHYMKKNQPLEAFRMYWLAPDRTKSEQLIEKMAGVIRGWLKESEHAG
ncbi:MAG: hypothetical protein ACOC1I_03635 [Spirochaetota bacterium]